MIFRISPWRTPHPSNPFASLPIGANDKQLLVLHFSTIYIRCQCWRQQEYIKHKINEKKLNYWIHRNTSRLHDLYYFNLLFLYNYLHFKTKKYFISIFYSSFSRQLQIKIAFLKFHKVGKWDLNEDYFVE